MSEELIITVYKGLLLLSTGAALLSSWYFFAGRDYFSGVIASVCGLVILWATVTG